MNIFICREHESALSLPWLAELVPGGTIPLTLLPGGVVERLMAPVLKTGRAKALVGSNPTPSAISENLRSLFWLRICVRIRRFERSAIGGRVLALGFQLWVADYWNPTDNHVRSHDPNKSTGDDIG